MVELADTLDLGSSAARREGSNPFPGILLLKNFSGIREHIDLLGGNHLIVFVFDSTARSAVDKNPCVFGILKHKFAAGSNSY